MAKKEKAETSGEGALVDAAKAIGKAAGKVAKPQGVNPKVLNPRRLKKFPSFQKRTS